MIEATLQSSFHQPASGVGTQKRTRDSCASNSCGPFDVANVLAGLPLLVQGPVVIVIICAVAIVFSFCEPTWADEACEQSYQNLKRFEEQHPISSGAAMAALQKGNHCSELVLTFEDQVDANARAISLFAKAFVAACGNDPSKADELAFYGLDGVLNPRPSTLRQRCKLEGK